MSRLPELPCGSHVDGWSVPVDALAATEARAPLVARLVRVPVLCHAEAHRATTALARRALRLPLRGVAVHAAKPRAEALSALRVDADRLLFLFKSGETVVRVMRRADATDAELRRYVVAFFVGAQRTPRPGDGDARLRQPAEVVPPIWHDPDPRHPWLQLARLPVGFLALYYGLFPNGVMAGPQQPPSLAMPVAYERAVRAAGSYLVAPVPVEDAEAKLGDSATFSVGESAEEHEYDPEMLWALCYLAPFAKGSPEELARLGLYFRFTGMSHEAKIKALHDQLVPYGHSVGAGVEANLRAAGAVRRDFEASVEWLGQASLDPAAARMANAEAAASSLLEGVLAQARVLAQPRDDREDLPDLTLVYAEPPVGAPEQRDQLVSLVAHAHPLLAPALFEAVHLRYYEVPPCWVLVKGLRFAQTHAVVVPVMPSARPNTLPLGTILAGTANGVALLRCANRVAASRSSCGVPAHVLRYAVRTVASSSLDVSDVVYALSTMLHHEIDHTCVTAEVLGMVVRLLLRVTTTGTAGNYRASLEERLVACHGIVAIYLAACEGESVSIGGQSCDAPAALAELCKFLLEGPFNCPETGRCRVNMVAELMRAGELSPVLGADSFHPGVAGVVMGTGGFVPKVPITPACVAVYPNRCRPNPRGFFRAVYVLAMMLARTPTPYARNVVHCLGEDVRDDALAYAVPSQPFFRDPLMESLLRP